MIIPRYIHPSRTITLLITVCFISIPAHAQYSGGTGEPNDPYQIAAAEDLMLLGESPEDYDKHFILTDDIDLDPNLPGRKVFDKAVIAPDMEPDRDWFQGTSFTGVFDGNGHKISHLTISGVSYLGLFGQITGAMISNLGLEIVDVNGVGYYVGGLVGHNGGTLTQCYSTGSVSGDWRVGGLVGDNSGRITTSHSASTVTADSVVGGLVGRNYYGSVTTSYSTGVVSGSTWVGGLVGVNGGIGGNSGKVTKCYSTSTVRGGNSVGGLVGVNNLFWHGYPCRGFIDLSYSTGMVTGIEDVGGLVGTNIGEVSNCYCTSTVNGDNTVGGLVGANFLVCTGYGSATYVAGGSITQCYSIGRVGDTGENVGGLVGSNECEDRVGGGVVSESFWNTQTSGQATSDGGTGKMAAEMMDPNTFMATGWDFVGQPDGPRDIWAEPEGGGYPILWWQLPEAYRLPEFSGGTGEPNDPYLISTAEELHRISDNPRLMKCNFKLVESLDLAGFQFDPIGSPDHPYMGVFDGNGRTVSHLTIAGGRYLGLFGYLAGEAEVRNLGVVDANITGFAYVSGLTGWNEGRIVECHSGGSVSGTSYSVGGLVGWNNGSIATSYSTALVSGDVDVGGLVGNNQGNIDSSYSAGAVSIDSSYSAGVVSGEGDYVGGLVGLNALHSGVVIQSFWDIETSGLSNMCGAQSDGASGCSDSNGKTTAEMQTAATFLEAGWDFIDEVANGTDDIWWILEGQDYPRLWWEPRN